MKTFSQYLEDAWGHDAHSQQLVARIEAKMSDLQRDLDEFTRTLTHGDEAVSHAASHLQRSFETMTATLRMAVRKNTGSPEWGDHPPVSIDQ